MRTFLIASLAVFVVAALVALFAGDSLRRMASFGTPEGTAVRIEPVATGQLVEIVAAPGTV